MHAVEKNCVFFPNLFFNHPSFNNSVLYEIINVTDTVQEYSQLLLAVHCHTTNSSPVLAKKEKAKY